MADECVRVLIRLLLTFRSHYGCSDLYRFARSHVAGFAAIYDVGVGNVDLLNLRIPLGGFLAQSVNLRGVRLTMGLEMYLEAFVLASFTCFSTLPNSGLSFVRLFLGAFNFCLNWWEFLLFLL